MSSLRYFLLFYLQHNIRTYVTTAFFNLNSQNNGVRGEVQHIYYKKSGISDRNLGSGIQGTWAGILIIKFTSCVTLGNLLNLSVMLHPHL